MYKRSGERGRSKRIGGCARLLPSFVTCQTTSAIFPSDATITAAVAEQRARFNKYKKKLLKKERKPFSYMIRLRQATDALYQIH